MPPYGIPVSCGVAGDTLSPGSRSEWAMAMRGGPQRIRTRRPRPASLLRASQFEKVTGVGGHGPRFAVSRSFKAVLPNRLQQAKVRLACWQEFAHQQTLANEGVQLVED